jgi:cobalt-zinc-cadmium resistance protein CzcA
MVEVITQPPGWSPEEVERMVTIPLEIGLAGMPGLSHTRSQSLFGLSDIKCYFEWGTSYAAARQEVINRIGFVPLPDGVEARISPWNPVGEIYRYTVEGTGYTLMDRKTAQDWILERQFRRVPGVIDVTGFGGLTRQYHVNVDPFRLEGQGVSLSQLSQALQNSNQNVGGQRLTLGSQSFDVRGVGLLRDVHDIDRVVIAAPRGTPIRVGDVARTEIGHAPRLGIIGIDDRDDVVQGIVLMYYGGHTENTLAGVHERVDRIRSERRLPPGMEIRPYYDRGELVRLTMRTVMENVLVGIGLVTLVLALFLASVRAALITAVTIPLALLVAFCGLAASNTSANLLSLGAIDFGIVVDSTVIMVENIFRHLGRGGEGTMKDRVLAAAREVGRPMAFSTTIIALSFLPLFTLTGVAGVIFSPMARTYALAIAGAVVLALTLTPVLSARFLKPDQDEKESAVMRAFHRAYEPVVGVALRHPAIASLLAGAVIVLGVVLFPLLGREFMPKLEEGNLWIRIMLPSSISLEQSSAYVSRMRRIIRGCSQDPQEPCTRATQRHPQVRAAISQVGRPDDGTDVTGFYNIEIFAPLEPFDRWPDGQTKEKLIETLSAELQAAFPGAELNFSQMILDNVEEAVAGVKGENAIKVFGPDLEANEATARSIVDTMSRVRGVTDLGMFHTLGQPSVRITPDRVACARYGLNTGDIDAVVEAAIGGQALTQVYEGERHFDLTVRWQPPYRESVDAIRRITVSTPDGARIPLAQLASIEMVNGPVTIYREDGERYSPVKFSVRGRDLASTIAEAQASIAGHVRLAYGMHLEWSGEMNELRTAEQRLLIIVPVTLALVLLLTYSAVGTWIDTVIVMLSIPVACTGGVLALLITGTHFSVSAAMGFISIFGLAVQDAILVVTYYQRLRGDGLSIVEAAHQAAEKRFRPVLMTTLVATLGLLPAAVSTGIGAQTQKPLAIVVIGGSLILAVLTRVLQPPMLVLAHGWFTRHGGDRKPSE